MGQKGWKGTTIYIKPEFHHTLKLLATYKGLSLSELSEIMIAEYINKEKDTVRAALKVVDTTISAIN